MRSRRLLLAAALACGCTRANPEFTGEEDLAGLLEAHDLSAADYAVAVVDLRGDDLGHQRRDFSVDDLAVDDFAVDDFAVDDQAPPDDLTTADDLTPADDLAGAFVGVVCGFNAPCAAGDACCTLDNGGPSSRCIMSMQSMFCTFQRFECDGPEDCDHGDVCCPSQSGASCTSAGHCASDTGSNAMCHVDADCADGESCCPLAPQSPYRACNLQGC
jgi:hypothetical protein